MNISHSQISLDNFIMSDDIADYPPEKEEDNIGEYGRSGV